MIPGTTSAAITDVYRLPGHHEFHDLKHLIKSQWFESSKKRIAKQAIRNNHFSAMQIRELLFLFDFESNKLDVAKFAFLHTCDQANFYVVNDVFHFQSSVRSLHHFMDHHRF